MFLRLPSLGDADVKSSEKVLIKINVTLTLGFMICHSSSAISPAPKTSS